MSQPETWSNEHGQRLRGARGWLRQSQAQCAVTLLELGAGQASQASVSEWENNQATPSGAAKVAIFRYCSRVEADTSGDLSAGDAEVPSGKPTLDRGGLDPLMRAFSGEPILGPSQQRAIDAVLSRLATGTPLTEADDRTIARVFQALALTGTPDPSLEPSPFAEQADR